MINATAQCWARYGYRLTEYCAGILGGRCGGDARRWRAGNDLLVLFASYSLLCQRSDVSRSNNCDRQPLEGYWRVRCDRGRDGGRCSSIPSLTNGARGIPAFHEANNCPPMTFCNAPRPASDTAYRSCPPSCSDKQPKYRGKLAPRVRNTPL